LSPSLWCLSSCLIIFLCFSMFVHCFCTFISLRFLCFFCLSFLAFFFHCFTYLDFCLKLRAPSHVTTYSLVGGYQNFGRTCILLLLLLVVLLLVIVLHALKIMSFGNVPTYTASHPVRTSDNINVGLFLFSLFNFFRSFKHLILFCQYVVSPFFLLYLLYLFFFPALRRCNSHTDLWYRLDEITNTVEWS
jgi:hypothetical protein